MKIKYMISLLSLLVAFITCPTILKANEPCTIVDISKTSGLSEKVIELLSLEWTKKARICDLGYYKIAVPADGKSSDYFLWTEKGPLIISSNTLEVTFFDQNPQNESYKILVSLQDRGKKGFFNRLSYRTLDPSGKPTGNIMDINMDGQPDFKFFDYDKEKKKGQVWINKEWYELDKRDGQTGIFDKGKFLPVELTDNGWQIKK